MSLFDSVEYFIWNIVFSFFFLIVLLLTFTPIYILLILGILGLLNLFNLDYMDAVAQASLFIGLIAIFILDGLLTRSATQKKVYENLGFKDCFLFSTKEFLLSISMNPILKIFKKKKSNN